MSDQILLCTDLDRTLLPNGPQPESELARDRFRALVSHPDICLVYVSGRHLDLVEEAIEQYQLPEPDFIIGDVGTTLYQQAASSGWTLVDAWQQSIAQDWKPYKHQQLAQFIKHSELTLQEAEKQNRFKLSYYVPLNASREQLTSMIESSLQQRHIRATLIWSIDEPNSIGLLDIVPAAASKYHAIEFLLGELQIDLAHCVFCGDSGNDMEVLTSPIQSVLVGNSAEDVQQQALIQVQRNGYAHSLYLAQGDFMEMNANYSGGMLEGIAHFFPHTRQWMRLDSNEVQLQ